MMPASCMCLCMLVVATGWISSAEATTYVDSDYHIKLPDIEYMQHSKSIHEENQRQKRKIMYFKLSPHRKWPTNINYMISNNLEFEQQQTIVNVIQEDFEGNTCLKFNRIFHKNESRDTQFINIRDHGEFEPSACKAYIGMENDTRTVHGQPIYLGDGCLRIRGRIIHMIAATLGMYNEIQRPDRDNYVEVFYDKINPKGISNFIKQSNSSVNTHNVPYDYASAMHYRSKAWLKEGVSGHTVLPLDRSLTHLLGQLSEISFYDIQVLNHEYCSHVCPGKKKCYNGGYEDPKNCGTCLCPDGFAGFDCRNIRQGTPTCTPLSSTIDVTEEEKCVSSPGYDSGGHYTQGDHCSWRLDAPPHKVIDFWFHQSVFGIPHLNAASTDNIPNEICVHWVEIKYKGLHATRGARYCDKDYKNIFEPTSLPIKSNVQTSSMSSVLVLFKSPPAYTRQSFVSSRLSGFKLCFKISSGIRSTTTPAPSSTGNTTASSNAVLPLEEKHGISMIAWIVAVIAVLLFTVIVFAIVIICLLYRRKKKQPETVVVANGMNNPGYAEHAFPVVSFHEPEGLDKKMAVFGAMGATMGDLPPKYDDVPEVPAYAISGDQVKDLTVTQDNAESPNPYPTYEVPRTAVPISERIPDDREEPIYQNTAATSVNKLKQKFEG